MAAKQRYELWVGILLAVAMALLAWMAIKVGAVGGLGEQVHAQIRIHDAAGIAPGASVLVYGVEVGRVERMELGDGAAIATVSLQAQAHLQRNALVLIRARSVLGEKYLEMKPQPGEAALIAEGDELAISEDQIEIDEIVNQSGRVLQAVDAEAMAAAFREMSQELAKDPGRLNAAFKNLEVLLQRGAEVAEKLPAVVDHADATLARLDALLDEG
ncbi:MAG TPA: MlaD family protein, partial [Myxococcota bacterium]|nr:MlaD family protein [Myxococcota bacterium]